MKAYVLSKGTNVQNTTYATTNLATEQSEAESLLLNNANTKRMKTSNMPTRVGLAVNSQKSQFNICNDPNILSDEPDEKINDEIASDDDSQKLSRSIFGLGDERNSFISLDTGNLANGTMAPTNELDITSN